jgi:cytosine permease
MSSTTELQHRDLAAEYEHEPVPAQARRSLTSIAAVWFGFPMNLGNAPVAIQLIGPHLGDGAVLAAAAAYERSARDAGLWPELRRPAP